MPKESKPKPTGRNLDEVLRSVNKRFGVRSVVRASSAKSLERVRRIQTGMFDLDLAFGGGVPVDGKMIHLWGGESSGKSVLAHRIAGAFQRHCRACGKPLADWDELTMTATPVECCRRPDLMKVVWLDAERSWDNQWATKLGVNVEHIYLARTQYGEQMVDIAEALIHSGYCDLLVLDSVAALTPSAEVKGEASDSHVGVHPRLINYAMRVWTSAQSAGGMDELRRCTIVMINQVRMKIGVMYGSPETQPGGKGLKFHAHIEARVKRKGVTMEDDRPVGHALEVACKKNKTAPPLRSAALEFRFVPGQNRATGSTNLGAQVLRHAVAWGIVKQGGSWFYLAKGVKMQGAEEAALYLEKPDQRPLLKLLMQRIWELEVAWLGDGTIG